MRPASTYRAARREAFKAHMRLNAEGPEWRISPKRKFYWNNRFRRAFASSNPPHVEVKGPSTNGLWVRFWNSASHFNPRDLKPGHEYRLTGLRGSSTGRARAGL